MNDLVNKPLDERSEKLRKIMEDLSEIPSVQDFWIADSRDEVLVCHNGLHKKFPNAISEMKESLEDANVLKHMLPGSLMSRERLLNYHGYTVLYGHAANGLQLFFFLKKDAYLSLMMLEMESFLRKIEESSLNISA
jgi:hypothetical protein